MSKYCFYWDIYIYIASAIVHIHMTDTFDQFSKCMDETKNVPQRVQIRQQSDFPNKNEARKIFFIWRRKERTKVQWKMSNWIIVNVRMVGRLKSVFWHCFSFIWLCTHYVFNFFVSLRHRMVHEKKIKFLVNKMAADEKKKLCDRPL